MQKPAAIPEYLFCTYTNEGNMVLDNCMGIGSTGIARVHISHSFIGVELNDHYFGVTDRRIAEAGEKIQNNQHEFDGIFAGVFFQKAPALLKTFRKNLPTKFQFFKFLFVELISIKPTGYSAGSFLF